MRRIGIILRTTALAAMCLAPLHAIAGLDEGLEAARNGDYPSALMEFIPLAEAGDAHAQFMLGEMYANGQGLSRDYKKAVEWLRKSAEQGFADSQLRLGEMSAKGLGMEVNHEEAAKWFGLAASHSDVDGHFRETAEQGLVASQLKLAKMYADGQGVEQSYEKAAKWYHLAADNQNAEAQVALGLMYLQGKGVEQDFQTAKTLFENAAIQNNAIAQYNLGVFYLKGLEVKVDEQEAASWFLKSAQQGNPRAQFALGTLYEDGRGVPINKDEAINLYRKAAEQGNVQAQEKLLAIENIAREQKAREENKKSRLSFGQISQIDIFKNFGLFGGLLLASIACWLGWRYSSYRRLNWFKKLAESSLNDLCREVPSELSSALSKAKLGLLLGIVVACAFIVSWGIKAYVGSILLTVIWIINIEHYFFSQNKLALKFITLVGAEDEFYDTEAILLKAGVIEDSSGLWGKMKGVLDSKKKKKKLELSRDKGEKLLLGILACLEARGRVQVFNLGFSYYFCNTGYLDRFCKEIISEAVSDGKNNAASGIKIKNLVKAVAGRSILDRLAAYDLIIGYFKYGKAFVKNGEFVFYLEEQLDDIAQCDCCGQVIVDHYEIPSSNLSFCSEDCKKYYLKLSNEDFEPSPDFSNKLIERGVKGLTAVAGGALSKRNQKVFAIGGQGHGFAAEKANNAIDKFTGNDAQLVGDDNAKNGPDRRVNGINIQTKYCKTAARSIGAAFDGQTGNYRYIDETTKKPMKIEVPRDQYERAIKEIRKKAEDGKIPGVSPDEAEKLVIKGSITYDAAVKICQFGTIEGLAYDFKEGVEAALPGMGISFIASYAQSYWSGNDAAQAFQSAAVIASKSLAKATATMILVQQLQRLSFVQNISIPVPQSLNPLLAKGLKYGQGQVKNYLRGVAVTNAVMIGLSASKDMFSVINNQMSGGQFFKNATVTTVGVVGGSAGAVAGQVLGGMLGSLGGPVGALLGGMVVGHLTTQAVKTLLDQHIDDDKAVILRMAKYRLNQLADSYLMTPEETQVIIDNVMGDALNNAPNRRGFINMNKLLLSHVQYLVKRRPVIKVQDVLDAANVSIQNEAAAAA